MFKPEQPATGPQMPFFAHLLEDASALRVRTGLKAGPTPIGGGYTHLGGIVGDVEYPDPPAEDPPTWP